MKKYKLRIGLDVDDILYDCNGYALERLNAEEGIDPPLTIYDIKGWGPGQNGADGRLRYFSDPDFVASQPILPYAAEMVRKLCAVADVFFVTAVPPECMSARAERLVKDFPDVPPEHILIGTRKDMVNLDILLDDGAHNIARTPAAYPVLFRKPWNTHLSGLLSVNSYEDFLHLVEIIRHSFAEKKPNLKRVGIVCLVGPTGSGKTAVAQRLIEAYDMQKPITATTRQRRENESVGHYRFISEAEFVADAEAGRFLETTVYSGHYFGTEAKEIDAIVARGKIAVIPIDICGALTLKTRYKHQALLVFLHRDRYDVVRDIVSRDLPPDDLTRRILSLDDEYRNEDLCDLTVRTDKGENEAADAIVEAIGVAKKIKKSN